MSLVSAPMIWLAESIDSFKVLATVSPCLTSSTIPPIRAARAASSKIERLVGMECLSQIQCFPSRTHPAESLNISYFLSLTFFAI